MHRTILACAALLALAGTAAFAEPGAEGFACADYTAGKVCFVKQDGTIAWEYPAPSCNDFWVLRNGNILFTTGHGVKELTRDKQVVFNYESKSEIYACQRMRNGNTFVGECNAGRLLEIAPDGKIVKEIKLLEEGKDGGHAYIRNARRLQDGHYLVAHYADQVVREYDADGKKVAEFKAPGGPHSTCRLPDGSTLIATGDATGDPHLLEYDKDGKLVWEVTNKDLEGAPLKFLTGFHRLPNGNTVISNWLGHGHFGEAPHLLEITRDKKVVWKYENHKDFKTISSVEFLGLQGRPLH